MTQQELIYIEKNKKNIISDYNENNIRKINLKYHCSQEDIINILRESIAKNDRYCLMNNS